MSAVSRKNSNRWVEGVIGHRELFNCGIEVLDIKFCLMHGGGWENLKFMSGRVQKKQQQIDGWWQTNSFEQKLKENNCLK